MNISKYSEELAEIMTRCLDKIKEGDWKEVAYLDAYCQGMQAAKIALGTLTTEERTKMDKDMIEFQEKYWAERYSKEMDKWEVGFRNIVTILVGADQKFEIKDVVEKVRAMKESAKDAVHFDNPERNTEGYAFK